METGTRALSVSLDGTPQAIPAVLQACNIILDWNPQSAAPDPDETDADEETDADGPQLQSAAVNGATLTLAYDEALDAGAAPSSSAFTVTVDGTERSIIVVGVGGTDVLLTLSSAVEAGDAVTVAYDKPDGANAIKDTHGNKADSFAAQAVTNNTAQQRSETVQPPESLGVARHETGKLKATWEAPASGPAPTGYTVQWKESTNNWDTAADVSQANVKGTSHIITGLTDGTAYSVRVKARKGSENSDPTAEATATPTETVAPTLSSAAVDAAELTITFSEALDPAQTPDKSAFSVSVAGTSRAVTAVSVSNSAVTLTLASAVTSTDAVTVGYTAPTGESDARLKDLAGNEAASFAAQAVTNNTPAAVQPPESLGVARHETGKLKATWEAPASGPAPTGYTVQWKESTNNWDTAADVSQANVKGTSHIITGLTDGTAYSVRVKARKGSENSDPTAEATATPTETVAPTLSSAAVDAAELTITFSEALDPAQTPDKSAFSVSVAGTSRAVTAVSVSNSAVTLTLASAVTSTDAVTVGYTAPTGESDARLKDLAGNEAASFAAQAVTNNTPAATVQLTAAASAVPASHSGQPFTFELRFSEEPKTGFSYKTMKNHAFTVTGGSVDKADRLNRPSNIGWKIYVTPTGNGAVTIVLPATTDCTATGAVCTQDGRKLSTRLQITIPGPGG